MEKNLMLIFMVAFGIKSATIGCMEDLQNKKKTRSDYQKGKKILNHINKALKKKDYGKQEQWTDKLNDFMEGYLFFLSQEDRCSFKKKFNKISTKILNALSEQMSSKQKSSESLENQPSKENLLMQFLHSLPMVKFTDSKSGHNSPNNSKPPSPILQKPKLSHSRSGDKYQLLRDDFPQNSKPPTKISQVKSSPNIKMRYEELKKTEKSVSSQLQVDLPSSGSPVFSKKPKNDQKVECKDDQEDLRSLFEKMQLLGHLYLEKKSMKLISEDSTKEIEYYSKKYKN